MADFQVDAKEIVVRILKYFLEGAVVAIAAYMIPKQKPKLEEVLTIALIAAATFSLLDLAAPSLSQGVRAGASFGIGAGLVGFPGGNFPQLR